MRTTHVAIWPAVVCTMLLAFAFPAHAQQSGGADDSDWTQAARDAWIAGKLESAYLLNEHLNPFDIDIDVNHGVIVLSGSVQSDIQKELAGTIAEGIEGAEGVENKLAVNPDSGDSRRGDGESGSRGFGQWVSDATTTAVVKTKLAANEHIHSLDIDVDTLEGVVTLTGTVDSPEARTLAGVIASNSRNVRRVENELTVE